MSEAAIRRLERTLGKSVITVTGVEPDTHFAQVLVAADFRMKRLALGFEPAPINDLPSYLQMLQAGDQPPPQNAIFRLWLALKYDAVLRDTDGLAWELVGDGVQTLTEAGLRAGPDAPPVRMRRIRGPSVGGHVHGPLWRAGRQAAGVRQPAELHRFGGGRRDRGQGTVVEPYGVGRVPAGRRPPSRCRPLSALARRRLGPVSCHAARSTLSACRAASTWIRGPS